MAVKGYLISPQAGKVWLLINSKWVVYQGTTSVRKLYYRAHDAMKLRRSGFWVYEHGRVQGAWFHKDWYNYTSTVTMDGTRVENLATRFDLRKFNKPERKMAAGQGCMIHGTNWSHSCGECGGHRSKIDPRDYRNFNLEDATEFARQRGYSKFKFGPDIITILDGIVNPTVTKQVYLAGSLRSPHILQIHKALEAKTGYKVFSDWFAAGHEADDWWKSYYTERGFTYEQALKEPASVNVFNFDKKHIDASDVMVLALPAGKSGHLELGYHLGKGKPGYILLEDADRWDVMYQFATGVTTSIEELSKWIKELK